VNGILSKTYWSSGYGASALSFGWCTANATIDARLWKIGEPGAATGCVSATFPKMPKNATGERQKRVMLLFSKSKLFLDESAYAAFLEVTECEQNNSFICVVKFMQL